MARKQPPKQVTKPVNPSRPPVATPKDRLSLTLKLALFLGAISILVYANTLKNGYVLDDGSVITENTIITKGMSAIPEILSTPYRKGVFSIPNDLYRPLSLVMFATEYEFFGPDPVPGHFVNILLFAACVIMLFLVLDGLMDNTRTPIAFMAALLFALHPIHTEVVANIKSRDELLCFFFAFLSLKVFMKYAATGKSTQLILASCCFFLSLLSKETVITFVAVIPLIFFFIKNENKKRSTYITICTAAVVLIFLSIRLTVLNAYHANEISIVNFVDNALAKSGLSFESRIATAIFILGDYIKLLVIPYPLICDYSYSAIPFTHFSDPKVLLSLSAFIFLAIFGVYRFIKNHKDAYAFAILFFLITLSLFSNIPFLIGTHMGERLLFFPSVGFCLAIALLIGKIAEKTEERFTQLTQPKILAVIIPICLIFAALTISRNSDWLNNYTLFSTDIKKAPDNCKLNCLMGSELEKMAAKEIKDTTKQQQLLKDAIGYLTRSISIYPEFSDAQYNLAFAYFSLSRYDSAELHDKRAIEILPVNLNATSNLAKVYFMTQKYAPSVTFYKRAIALDATDVAQYTNVGVCYFYLGKFDSSIYYSNIAISKDPSLKASYEILAFAYKAIGNRDSSAKYEMIAKRNNPKFKLN